MIVEKFKPEHLWEIELQPAQRSWHAYGSLEYAQRLAQGIAFSGRIRGRLVACGGILDVEPDVGHLWCFLSHDAHYNFVRLHRTTLRFLQVTGKHHLIATAEADFADGCRWLELLGFAQVRPLPGYGPDGKDHLRYERHC